MPRVVAMFALELAFDDNPARLHYRAAHREKLAALAADGKILASGPWSDDSGALIVFAVATQAEAETLIAADDYFRAPGVTVVSLRKWQTPIRHPALRRA